MRYHITAPPTMAGAVAAHAQRAERRRYAMPSDIEYINAHGTSTPAGRRRGDAGHQDWHVGARYTVPVHSTKSMIGHLLGAAGAVEAIYTALAIRHQISPPTINLRAPERRLRPRLRAECCAADVRIDGAVELVRLRRHERHVDLPQTRLSRRAPFGASIPCDSANPSASVADTCSQLPRFIPMRRDTRDSRHLGRAA